MANSKYDLTKDEILSPKKIRYKQRAGIYVGTAEQIATQKEYGTFCVNDGKCDCCGGYIFPWIIGGLCKDCLTRMEEDKKNIIFPIKRERKILPYPQKFETSKVSEILIGVHADTRILQMNALNVLS